MRKNSMITRAAGFLLSAVTALSKDGTLALICMDQKDAPADMEQREYVYNL